MANPLNIVLDNPVLVKHLRSRLRPSQFIPALIVVLCICLLVVYFGLAYGSLASGTSFLWLFGLCFLTLGAAGGQQVASAVGGAKDGGILDFHRVSPQAPVWLTVGFLLGAPVREYLMFALALPFTLYAAVNGPLGLFGFFEFLVPLVLASWLIHSLTMLTALVSKKAKSAAQGGLIAMVILLMFGFFGVLMPLWSSATSGFEDVQFRIPFFGTRLPWMAYLTLYVGTAIGFFLVACTRKMKADRAHAYSKPGALAFMAAIVTLAIGAMWQAWGHLVVVPALVYLFLIAGVILGGTVTPDLGEYQRGIRRALRAGRRRAPIFDDAASNQWAIYGLAALMALGASIGWEAIEKRHAGEIHAEQVEAYPEMPAQVNTQPVVNGQPAAGTSTSVQTYGGAFQSTTVTTTTVVKHANGVATISRTTAVNTTKPSRDPTRLPYSHTIAIGVFTVAYFGFGAQYFALRFGRRGEMFYRLFLFFFWLMPLLAGAGAGLANLESKAVQIILAISPLAGVALSAIPEMPSGPQVAGDAARFAALLPSITFAFLFHFLLTATQRRIDRSLRQQDGKKKPGADPEVAAPAPSL